MWKYQHPDFALFLLGELQKQQQQGSVFCDTLLQSDGVCIPAHSCVLAALSPVFCRILSSSPAPHAGQNRLLNLEAVGSRTLLKLVSFLYTGEMEISSQSEHEEVMATALRLGLRNLLGKKIVLVESAVEDVERRWRETGVQTEAEGEIVSEPQKTQSSAATSVQPCSLSESDLPPLCLFDEVSSARGFNLTSNVTVASFADITEASSHHKTKKMWKMAMGESQLNGLPQQQHQMKLLTLDESKLNQTGMAERSKTVSGKDFRKLLDTDKGQKSNTAEQKEARLDQLKIKIKLRRMRGASWESHLLVSVGESNKKPEEGKESGTQTLSCPPGVLPVQSFGTLTPPTDMTISPSNSSTNASSDKSLPSPHHTVSSPLDVATLSSIPPPADESDEHIAMLLEDMFMMGLNILPLMPLERNLEEHDQLASLQEQKDEQRDTEAPTQGIFVQSCESQMSESAPQAQSPGRRDEEHSSFHNYSKSNTVKLQESLGQDHLNNITNLPALPRHSPHSLVEDLFLSPKASAVRDYPSPTADVLASILDDKPDLRLLQCLSPLESEKGDSDVPKQDLKSSHSQQPEKQNLPLWLSESPLKLDFPLSSMIDFSCPHLQCDLNACQNRSSPDPAENQELKTSFSHNNLISGSSSNTLRPDISNDGKQPKQRKTRRGMLAIRKTKGDRAIICQNLENEDRVQPRISKCDVVASNARRASTRMTNRNRKGVKRKRESALPLGMKTLITDSKQEHADVFPQPEVPVVKRRRGRPPKSTTTQTSLCINAKTLPTLGENDCGAKNAKTDSVTEQASSQEPNTQQEKDSTGMEEPDVNQNSAQKAQNLHKSFSNKVKGACILDHIFHQTHPGIARTSSVVIDQLETSSLRDASFCLQKFKGGKSEEENGKLMMSEQLSKEVCVEKNAETSILMNTMEDEGESDSNTRIPLSCDNVKCPVKDGEIITGNNSSRTATVLQSVNVQKEMAKDTQMEEGIMKDVGDTEHSVLPTNTGCAVITNGLTMIEGTETSLCKNTEFPENSEALVSNERSLEVTDNKKDIQPAHVNTQDMSWVSDSLEDMEKEEEEIIEETMEEDETEALKACEFVEENTLLVSDDVCWKTTNGMVDKDGCDFEVDQYMIDGQMPLEDEDLSEGHAANAEISDDPSSEALTQRNAQEIIYKDSPEALEIHSLNACSEDASVVLSNTEIKEECQLDEDDIEVDVVEVSVDSSLLLLTTRQVVTLSTEFLLDQEDEQDEEQDEEEEEVDVTGGETE